MLKPELQVCGLGLANSSHSLCKDITVEFCIEPQEAFQCSEHHCKLSRILNCQLLPSLGKTVIFSVLSAQVPSIMDITYEFCMNNTGHNLNSCLVARDNQNL